MFWICDMFLVECTGDCADVWDDDVDERDAGGVHVLSVCLDDEARKTGDELQFVFSNLMDGWRIYVSVVHKMGFDLLGLLDLNGCGIREGDKYFIFF